MCIRDRPPAVAPPPRTNNNGAGQAMDEDPEIEVRGDDADLPEMAEHQGQAPADAIPIPAGNSQAEIDRCIVAVGAK
eukprot:715758-Alexandrium_andersonii.AAC.1